MTTPTFVTRDDVLSWGRVQRLPQRIAAPRFRDQLRVMVEEDALNTRLATGLRRSYGDSCLNSRGAMIDMRGLDRFIAFDAATGTLRAEAGVSLSQILAFAVPRGWFLPTTPGTRFVTLGGAVANDVHGKNHHRAGSFGRHVKSFGLLRSDGARCAVTGEDDPGLFAATVGDAFGRQYATVNYGIMYTAKGVAALFVPFGNLLTHATGNWHAVYTVGCIMNIVAALLGFFLLRPAINRRLKLGHELEAAPQGMTDKQIVTKIL